MGGKEVGWTHLNFQHYFAKQKTILTPLAERIRRHIEQHLRDGATIYISKVTVCELEFGAQKTSDPVRERRALYKILAPFDLVDGDAVNLPRHYGEVRRDLERVGQPIGAMDIMIAAHARALSATLVSNNVQKFTKVTGLNVVNWADETTE